jgi:hypothetical protein
MPSKMLKKWFKNNTSQDADITVTTTPFASVRYIAFLESEVTRLEKLVSDTNKLMKEYKKIASSLMKSIKGKSLTRRNKK